MAEIVNYEGLKSLLGAILKRARLDYHRHSMHEEASHFLESEYFEDICYILELSPEQVRTHIMTHTNNVPKKAPEELCLKKSSQEFHDTRVLLRMARRRHV